MREQANWSMSLGYWGKTQVRLHLFFILFGVFTLYLSWLDSRNRPNPLPLLGLSSLAVLLGSVLVHELGHLFMLRRQGAACDLIVLGPVGGLFPERLPLPPKAELITYLAGPAVNLLIVLCCIPLLLLGENDVVGLLNPLAPAELTTGEPLFVTIKLTFWINWLLAVVNLLPAFPLDGGRALRAAVQVAWPAYGYQRSVVLVAKLAQAAAVILLLLAAASATAQSATPVAMSLVPAWLPLTLLAIFLFFGAAQELIRLDEEEPLEDELDLFDFDEEAEEVDSPLRHGSQYESAGWHVNQASEHRRQKVEETEADEDRRVDEILTRLHAQGMNSLSKDDRALLDRVSQRYRKRQSSS